MTQAETSRRRHEACKDVADAINPLKSRLIDLLSKLEQAEAKDAANRLGRIIGSLEGWQARHTR